MFSYFKDHLNCLVRVEPLCNLPIGYLTPSPTRSHLVNLAQFLLVDIRPIPMEQHKQDPPRHVLAGAHNGQHELLGHVLGRALNGQHGVDRRVEEQERFSNVGEVKAQIRTVRDYMNPIQKTPTSTIVLPAHHITLNLKPGILQALPQFHSYNSERPYTHLKDFEDACSIFQDNSCPQEVYF